MEKISLIPDNEFNIISKTVQELRRNYYTVANILNNIELDNDTSEGRDFNKITDDETFNNFVDEFNKQSTRIIKQIEKELGYEMPYIPNLSQLFELGKMLEK